eukprot:CAMPEP_0183751132 /NCGR_PEP_ID=MMETSP0739-20130205/1570_1 /TAXON_ID=385413 /ORGANISM="Thalassiosira miniscula, Strain CCMP1093" /LENGTH=38 /DNA_ID= /DNA_START= /DNA_END= /DNA_ORIENTATION=
MTVGSGVSPDLLDPRFLKNRGARGLVERIHIPPVGNFA